MRLRKERLMLDNVSCHSCFWEIQISLEELSGFVAMTYDIPAKSIDVEYDAGKLTRAEIERKIETAGFFIQGKVYEQIGLWESLRRAFTRHNT